MLLQHMSGALWRRNPTEQRGATRVPLSESYVMSGPEKSGHVVYGAILFPRLLVHSRQNYGILYIGMQQSSEIDFVCTTRCTYTHREHMRKRSQSIWVGTDVIIVSLSD